MLLRTPDKIINMDNVVYIGIETKYTGFQAVGFGIVIKLLPTPEMEQVGENWVFFSKQKEDSTKFLDELQTKLLTNDKIVVI